MTGISTFSQDTGFLVCHEGVDETDTASPRLTVELCSDQLN